MPTWAKVNRSRDTELQLVGRPPNPSGIARSSYNLRIWATGTEIQVAERCLGDQLPRSCPERHINNDGTFCVGLDAGSNITGEESAIRWWRYLAEYLQCQEFAAKHRRWPPGKHLSHGNAARYQIAAEKFASALGLLQDYRDAVEHKIGWLSGSLPKASKKEHKILNGRARCPRDCKTRKGAPILRRQCRESQNMWGLISNETGRRAEELRFIQSYKRDEFACCGSMNNCPFQE